VHAVVTPSPPVSSRGRESEREREKDRGGQKSWRCCDTSVARVRLCFPNARAGTQRVQVPVFELAPPGFKYSGRTIRHRNDPRARTSIHPLAEGGRGGSRGEGCGVYKADCPSCIPSGLLGILSPYPLHALSRCPVAPPPLFLPRPHSRLLFLPPLTPSPFPSPFVRRLSRRAILIAFEYPAGGISRSDQDVVPMLP